MKKFYLFLLLITAVSFYGCNNDKNYGCNNDKKNDLTKAGLKGNVKYIERKIYSAVEKFGEAQKDKLEDYKFISFNKGGNFVNFIINDRRTIYKYDSKGNNIEELNFLGGKNIYKYDSKGNMIEKSDYDSNGIFEGKQVSKYDSEGNLIEHIEDAARYSNNEVIIKCKNTYKYDSEGNMIEENNYQSILNSEWKFMLKILKTYDSKGNWVKKIIKDENGKTINIIERKIVYYGDKDENNYPEWDSPSYKGIQTQLVTESDVPTETQTETPLTIPVY